MVTTAQILADKALQAECGEQCVDWAIDLLARGHEELPVCRLAAKLRPHNHFELASLRDQILRILGLGDLSADECLVIYARELLLAALNGDRLMRDALATIKDLYNANDCQTELQDFYLLCWAWDDLDTEHHTWHWPSADRKNIERITRDVALKFVSNNPNGG